ALYTLSLHDALPICLFDFSGRLAHAGEPDAIRIEPRDPRPPQLSHRHDVGARSELLEDTKYAEVAVGFDGVTDAMPDAVERVVERVVLRADEIGAVDVGGRTDSIRDGLEQARIEP